MQIRNEFYSFLVSISFRILLSRICLRVPVQYYNAALFRLRYQLVNLKHFSNKIQDFSEIYL